MSGQTADAKVSKEQRVKENAQTNEVAATLQSMGLAGIFVTCADREGRFSQAHSVFSPSSTLGRGAHEMALDEASQTTLAQIRSQVVASGQLFRGKLELRRSDEPAPKSYDVAVSAMREGAHVIGTILTICSPLPDGTLAEDTVPSLTVA